MNQKQSVVFILMVAAVALSAFVTYAFFFDSLTGTASPPMPDMGVPPAVLGLANAGIVVVLYGILGLAGIWLARRLNLPGKRS